MERKEKNWWAALFIAVSLLCILGCAKKEVKEAVASSAPSAQAVSAADTPVCVFIPGVVAGSPTYQMMVDGVKRAVAEYNSVHQDDSTLEVTVVEAGFMQADWETKLTSLAATGRYRLIISSNPSLPDIVRSVSQKFPTQNFILLDGELTGLSNVYTIHYRSEEESFLAGYFAALLSQTVDPQVKKVGLLAAQEYPVMNQVILPGFERGARAVDGDFSVDFRVLGNWFDADKAASLAMEIFHNGARVLLPIAGSANEGVVTAAKSEGAQIVWFDNDGAPDHAGVVAGSAVVKQDKAAHDAVTRFLNNTLPFGTSETVGVREGYIDFIPAPNTDAALVNKMQSIKTLFDRAGT